MLSGVVAATPAIAHKFAKAQTVTVMNFPLLDEFACGESSRDVRPVERICYVGGITRARGIVELIGALSLLPTGIRLGLAGKMDGELAVALRKLPGWERV